MADGSLFTDDTKVQKITPYRKLRNLRGWSLDEAAAQFTVCRRTLLDIELGRRDAPKWLVRRMDSVYGCGGQLIAYWLPRFSLAPVNVGLLDRLRHWFRRWQVVKKWSIRLFFCAAWLWWWVMILMDLTGGK